MSSNKNVYRVLILEDDNNHFALVLSDIEPTAGPNGEEIDPAFTVLLQEATPMAEVIVHEPTTGLYQSKDFRMEVPTTDPGEEINIDKDWPSDITLWQTELTPKDNMVGDSFCIIANPDREIGELTEDVILGDNILSVTPETLTALQKGIDVSISNGVKKEDLGSVIGINSSNNTITTENMVQSNFYTSTGTVKVLYNYCMVKDKRIENTNKIVFGTKGFKGKYVPLGMKMRMKYKNNNGEAKSFNWTAEYYLME